jgi:hypothetical protein
MSAHEKARRGFPPGRNFGVSISLIDGFDDHVNDFDPPARVPCLHMKKPGAVSRPGATLEFQFPMRSFVR